jgi:lysine 2,3-aminomutase
MQAFRNKSLSIINIRWFSKKYCLYLQSEKYLQRYLLFENSCYIYHHYKHTKTPVNRDKMENSEESLNDWKWQLRNSITTLPALEKRLELTPEEKEAINPALPLRITPYYLDVITRLDQQHPLRRCVIPSSLELRENDNEYDDPLNEEKHSPVKGIVHKYPDRVLFLVTNFCSNNCRYCTRSRIIEKDDYTFSGSDWKEAINYIQEHTEIRDVLISGGDPLTMSDTRLKDLLTSIRRIEHVEIIRIGTKVPVVMPQRITHKLVEILKHFHPLFMSIHFTHPDEITPECAKACTMLADAGIPLGSQTVLLKGVNNNLPTIRSLMHKLLKIRVKPYYLYQCDAIKGSQHFRTSVSEGVEIIKGLRGYTSGYAIPTFVVDTRLGKIPVNPDYIMYEDDNNIFFDDYMHKSLTVPK